MNRGMLLLAGAAMVLLAGRRRAASRPTTSGEPTPPPSGPSSQPGQPVEQGGAVETYIERGVAYDPGCSWFHIADFDDWADYVQSVIEVGGGIPAPDQAAGLAASVWRTLFPECDWGGGTGRAFSGKTWQQIVSDTREALEIIARVPRDMPEPTPSEYQLLARAIGGLRE